MAQDLAIFPNFENFKIEKLCNDWNVDVIMSTQKKIIKISKSLSKINQFYYKTSLVPVGIVPLLWEVRIFVELLWRSGLDGRDFSGRTTFRDGPNTDFIY